MAQVSGQSCGQAARTSCREGFDDATIGTSGDRRGGAAVVERRDRLVRCGVEGDDRYRLRLGGLVARPLDLGLGDLRSRPPTTLVRDFQCVTGWRVSAVRWRGVSLAALLDEAGAAPGATAVHFASFDGRYTETLTLAQARRNDVVLAYGMDGRPRSGAHGGPARR